MIRSEAQAEELSAGLVTEQPGRLPAVVAVQSALDAGEKIPETSTAHDVAATMLSYFKALPQPFFPESISSVRFYPTFPECWVRSVHCLMALLLSCSSVFARFLALTMVSHLHLSLA